MATANDIYTRYRRGLIQRHIAKNGRLLEGIWLIEDGGGPSSAEWSAIRRDTIETLENRKSYRYSAYPVLIAEKFYDQPRQLYLAGGGDNPLLMGGLAMAVLALEELLNVSTRSLLYAERLLDFANASQIPIPKGGSGFFTRKRHLCSQSDQFSTDEISGMLVGLLFLKRAARGQLLQKVRDIAEHLGRFLYDHNYWIRAPRLPGRGNPRAVRGDEAFVFQYPFGRALSEITGRGWQTGVAIPDGWGGPYEASLFIDLFNVLRLNFNYTPRELFEDVVGVYGGLFNISQSNLFNFTMVLYCLLIVIEADTTGDRLRGRIARLGNNVIKAVSYDTGILDGGKKPFRHNCLAAIVGKRCAEISGDNDSGWNDHLDEKIARLQEGDKTWFADLPLGTPSDSTIPRFRVKNVDGALLWGEWYAWTKDGTRADASFSFMNRPSWDLDRTVGHIGPYECKASPMNSVELGPEYSADPGKGFRAEASGLDFLFARILASYFGYLPKPVLKDGDPEYASLPIDGPLSDGFLGNASTGDLHDLSVQARGCHLKRIQKTNERWYATHREGSSVHHYNDCFVCLPPAGRSRAARLRAQYKHAIQGGSNSAYLGNKRTNEIHHKKTATKRCHLDRIANTNRLYYDTLERAFLDGLNPCAFCVGRSDH